VADVIVVGSGATGSMAAQTLVEAGASVLMLDGGQRDERYAALVPDEPFVRIRRNEEAQHRYFLGDAFEGVVPGPVATGAQLTPPRQFITRGVAEFLPLVSDTFFPLESLALGGLASGWGLGCNVFSDAELRKAGLPAAEMEPAYELVAGRIGISGADDDARAYTSANLEGVMPAPPLDPAAALLLDGYSRKRGAMREAGFRLGRPALALVTRDFGGRNATALNDMDFYVDSNRAAWRPSIAVESLAGKPGFEYRGQFLVTRFAEEGGVTTVFGRDLDTSQERAYSCRRLVMAAGTLGTARIVLRSLGGDGVRLPFLSNPYTYIASLALPAVGKAVPERKTSLCQLILLHDEGGRHDDVAQAGIFTYQSLLMYRLLREIPMDYVDARILMRYLLSGFLIVGIFHTEEYSEDKRLWLERDSATITGDCLHATYCVTAAEADKLRRRERAYSQAIRQLGAWPLKRISPGHGASIHYAGTLPFSESEQPYHLAPSGRLYGTESVYVADGSGFRYLPGKGLTLSLMANAHRVASRLT